MYTLLIQNTMLRESLRVVTRTDDFVGTCLTGGFLLALSVGFIAVFGGALAFTPLAILAAPIALLPTLLVRGYYVRVIGASAQGAETLPSFIRWGKLYRDGLKSGLLFIGYVLPLVAIFGVIVVVLGTIELSTVTEASPTAVTGTVSALTSLFAAVYLLAVLYVQPAAVARFATTGRLRDGFALQRVLSRVTTAQYVTGWLLAVAVTIVGLVISVPLVAVLIGIPLVFYSRVVTHWLYGRGITAPYSGDQKHTRDSRNAPGSETLSQDVPQTGGTDARSDAAMLTPTRDSSTPVQTGRDVPLTASETDSPAASGDHSRQSVNLADDPESNLANSPESGDGDDPARSPRFESLPSTDPTPNSPTTSTHDLGGERLPVNHTDTETDTDAGDFEWGGRPDDTFDDVSAGSTNETQSETDLDAFHWRGDSRDTGDHDQAPDDVEEEQSPSTTEYETGSGGDDTKAER